MGEGVRGGLKKVGAAFVTNGGEEVLKDVDSWFSETAGGFKADLTGKLVEPAAEGGDGVGKAGEAGVAADFADGAKDADGAELFEHIGVAEDDGFEGGGGVFGLVLADGVEDSGDFLFGEAGLAQDGGCLRAGIGHMIPGSEGVQFLGAIADKNAKVMEPGSGFDDVAIVVEIGADGGCKRGHTRLVAEFVDGEGLFQNDTAEGLQVIRRHTTFVSQRGGRAEADVWNLYRVRGGLTGSAAFN
jgi:hypothetical protein